MKDPIIRAYNIKVEDPLLIKNLDSLHSIFVEELNEILNNENIQLDSFTKKEYSNKFKGEFYSKLGDLTNKHYLKWDHNNRAKYFRMLANNIRINFNSIKKSNAIAKICQKHEWNYKDFKDEMREDFKNENLYPTFAWVKNICRSQKVPDKHETFNLKLDYTYSQDDQTILQPDNLIPKYKIKLLDGWIYYEASVPFYVAENKFIIKFCKPSFFKDVNDNWVASISYKLLENKSLLLNKDLIMGIDLGKVKPFTASIINKKSREVISQELQSSKESIYLNNKILKLEKNRNYIYEKIDRYNYILSFQKKNYDVLNKRIRLELEIYYLKKKISILKTRLARLMARDVLYLVKKFNVKNIKMERLNFVENTGGTWAFSQQQDYIEEKMNLFNISFDKVYAANTSSQNPFVSDYVLGKENNRNIVFDDFVIDRDYLASINVASRPVDKKQKRTILKFPNLKNYNYPLFAKKIRI